VGLCICSSAYGQYELSILEQIESDYSGLRIEGRFEEAYNLANEITFYQRIHYGLYTQKQMPYVCEALKYQREAQDYQGAQDRISQLYWLSLRGEGVDDLSRAILCFIWLPTETDCTERTGWRPDKDTLFCRQQRRYIADQFIAATQLQIVVAEETQDKVAFEALRGLANVTSYHVLGVDGPEWVIELRGDEIYQSRNNDIRTRYRTRTYREIARKAEQSILE
jgi:hypothetical protein|tara:strand:- start:2917 stop:3585 length:669 start_codon:yes stop_codon:yes gene_type:complete